MINHYKVPSDSITESIIFRNFLGDMHMPPDPQSLACFTCMHVCFTHWLVESIS